MPTCYVSFSAEINPSTTEALIALIGQQVNAANTDILPYDCDPRRGYNEWIEYLQRAARDAYQSDDAQCRKYRFYRKRNFSGRQTKVCLPTFNVHVSRRWVRRKDPDALRAKEPERDAQFNPCRPKAYWRFAA